MSRAIHNGASHSAATNDSAAAVGSWITTQSVNTLRHAAALRLFREGEFGDHPAAPSHGHLLATNELLRRLRRRLLAENTKLEQQTCKTMESPTSKALSALVTRKERALRWVQAIERVWKFYLEIFGQRSTRLGPWLRGTDRIAADCYQAAYLGLGKARPVPAPPPFSFLDSAPSPATFRRGTRLRRIAGNQNPFPLIQLPYHRLVNPWTLGAVLHEVSHNLQNDLGLARAVPARVEARLREHGLPESVVAVWKRWNRETFADLSGLLLGGPAVAISLLDVVGRSPASTSNFHPRGPHPTPLLRPFLSFALLRRMGFGELAERFERLWKRTYRESGTGSIPRALVATFPVAHQVVVEAMCAEPFPSLGDKSLIEVLPFGAKEQQMVEEAAGRIASGTPAGVLPARFLIGAARHALEKQMASPAAITRSFYRALDRS